MAELFEQSAQLDTLQTKQLLLLSENPDKHKVHWDGLPAQFLQLESAHGSQLLFTRAKPYEQEEQVNGLVMQDKQWLTLQMRIHDPLIRE